MDKFDLKTATSLIPVMDGSEETTEKIIDAVELYNNYLKDSDQIKMLITFIVKTRLSKTAKLKLNYEYNDISSLLQDMKKYLLTKKSANSILCQLNNLRQNNMSINEYGNKLSDLLLDLTIAQADGNEKACAILRPINENFGIKKFCDGLRYKRLGTIISARDYSNLKDAVRAAEDEELAQPSTSNGIFSMRGKSNNRFNNHFNRGSNLSRGNRYNYYNQGSQYRGNYGGQKYSNNYQQQRFNGNSRGGYTRGNNSNNFSNFRGNGNPRFYRGRGTQGQGTQRKMFSALVHDNTQTENKEINNDNQFFRV